MVLTAGPTHYRAKPRGNRNTVPNGNDSSGRPSAVTIQSTGQGGSSFGNVP